MQFSRILTYPKYRTVVMLLLRVVIYLIVGIALINAWDGQAGYLDNVKFPDIAWSVVSFALIGFVLLLIPINWSLEALKWKLTCKTEKITFSFALKSVLTGLSLSSVIPFGIGAAAGRLMNLNGRRRIENVSGIFVGQWMQTIITLLFGLYGIEMVLNQGAGGFAADQNVVAGANILQA